MFETCMVESAGLLKSRNTKWTTAGAFALEGTLLALVVVATMVHTDAIPVNLRVLVPPYSAPQLRTELVPSGGQRGGGNNAFVQPTEIPREIGTGKGNPQIIGTGNDPIPGLPTGLGGGPTMPYVADGPRPIVHLDVPKRMIISTMDPAKLVRQVKPVYPRMAVISGIQGTVVLHAIIGKDGSIQNLEVVSGHPMLRAAAEVAVLQWRYKPTYLGGQTVEVETSINVNFRLGGR